MIGIQSGISLVGIENAVVIAVSKRWRRVAVLDECVADRMYSIGVCRNVAQVIYRIGSLTVILS